MKHIQLFEDFANEKRGLWDNIHAKRKRGEAPAKPGDKDYPSEDALKAAQANEMASSDVHYKEIMDMYHSGPFAKKKVGAAVCKNPNASQKQIEDALGDAGYEDMLEFIDALGIKEGMNESYEDLEHYMFFGNLENIKRKCEEILSRDFKEIDELLKNGHDWASDHVATAKENIDQVESFITNHFEGDPAEIESPEPGDTFEPKID
jgi:hypothetical protein